MTKPKHTPGPWSKPFIWDKSKPDILTIGGMRRDCPSLGDKSKRSRDHILDIDISLDREEMHANAHLISVAPEMLEAIRDILDVLPSYGIYNERGITKAREIVLKLDGIKADAGDWWLTSNNSEAVEKKRRDC